MLATVKSLLYLGTILLVGAGVFAHFIGPGLISGASAVRRGSLGLGVLLGAVTLLVASSLDIALTIRTTLGFLDTELVSEYIRFTRHGRATTIRIGLILIVAVLSLSGRSHPKFWVHTATKATFVAAGVALLATFSWTSHAVVMQGQVPMVADLIHFGAAAAWGGSMLYLATLPHWRTRNPELIASVERHSKLGLVSVVGLFATGVYAGLLHIWSPTVLTNSPYGRTLIIKVIFVLLTVSVAAVNRLWFAPRFRDEQRSGSPGLTRRFGILVRTEAVLLTAILITTGTLTTSPLPHP